MQRLRLLTLICLFTLVLTASTLAVSPASPAAFGEMTTPAEFSTTATRITFDDLAVGSHVSTQYAAAGILFDDTVGATPLVVANDAGRGSPPNALLLDPDQGQTSANVPLTFRLDPPVGRVGFWMGNGAGGNADLRAYTAEGALIATLTNSAPETLSEFFGLYSTANDIARVELDYGDVPQGEMIDNLTFERWRPAPSTAYLYLNQRELADSWQTWLQESGQIVVLLSLDEAAQADLSVYRTILVGADTGASNRWGSSELVAHILGSGAEIIGLGDGGYAFLGKTGATIGWPNGARASSNTAQITCSAPEITRPRAFALEPSGDVSLFAETSVFVAIHAAQPGSDLLPMASVPDAPDYWPVISEGERLTLWGYNAGPSAMTAAGRSAFLNLLDAVQHPRRLLPDHSVDTLILTACQRMIDIGYARPETEEMMGRVHDLANSSALVTNMNAINKDVRLAPAAVKLALAQWAGNESGGNAVARTNALVSALDGWIETLKQQTYPNLNNVIIVGSHEVLPMQARPADNYNETSWSLPQTSGYLYDLYHAGAFGHYLTDTPYGDLSYIDDGWGADRSLHPELAVGRLVETPTQIRDLIDTYIAGQAYLSNAAMLAAGSNDFMDGARAAADAMGSEADDSLIQSGFPSSLLSAKISAHPNIMFLAGHGNYNWITTRKWDQGFQSGPTANQGDMSEVGDLPNAVVVADGCHNGVNFGNQLYHAPTSAPTFADFPEEFARRHAGVYLAATGYTWISASDASDDVAAALYSEQIAALYLKHLLRDGYITSGQAWLATVDDYLATAGPTALTDGAHRRVLATYTLYGFPTYRWRRLFIPPNLIFNPYPIDFWWKQDILDRSDRFLRVRYELRLPPIFDPARAGGIAGLPSLGGLNEPLHPVLSLTPLLPPGSYVRSWRLDADASRQHTLRGPIPLPAMGNHDATFRPQWASSEFSPADPVVIQRGGTEPLRLRVQPVQQRGSEAAANIFAAPASSRAAGLEWAVGETRIWDRLVFTVDYVLGPSEDVDQDGLPTHWEAAYGLSDADAAGDNGSVGDPDGDGLENAAELRLGARPIDPDSDDDGSTDGWEAQNGTDPANPAEHRQFIYLPRQ